MDGEAFRVGGAHLPAAYPTGAAMEDPNQSQNQGQFLFSAKAAPLQLFGSTAVPGQRKQRDNLLLKTSVPELQAEPEDISKEKARMAASLILPCF